jgi:D-3-phosphoglycerate dehydrogenase
MQAPKVLVADPVSERGVAELKSGGALDVTVQTGLKEIELIEAIPAYSGLVVRSQTKATARVLEAARNLKVIGRAGVGVDNVDVEAATRRGIIVMNTPGGNTISTAEHAFSLLVSLARNIPQAHSTVKAGRWDRKKFEGVELYNKTIAILGMGRIGTELARRAIAFGMRVIAYDPYLSASRARSLQVELYESLEEILPKADFVTLHMPLTAETKYMINAERLKLTKPGVRIVNCARGGLVEEAALAEAIESGHVAGAALDVYETEPPGADFVLLKFDNVVLTPHLGASTAEAQESVGIEIAQSIRAALLEGTIRNAVNAPNLDAKTLAVIGPYITFGGRLGQFISQIAAKRCEMLRVNYSGKLMDIDTIPLTRAILTGFLSLASGSEVNQVNAASIAANRGLKVIETRESAPGDFTELMEVSAGCAGEEVSVAGTFFGAEPRIVRINGRHVEARPEGFLLILENRDRPGIVGLLGSILGQHGVNIARMALSRDKVGGQALTVLNLDSEPCSEVMELLRTEKDIGSAHLISL